VGQGVTVPPRRLGAIDFLSPRLGIALTAAQVPCSVGPGQGIGFPRQQVRLAVSSDGGVRWAPIRAVNPQGAAASFDVFSPHQAWVLATGAGLWGTSNGTHWHRI
jgi:hypothetical protein